MKKLLSIILSIILSITMLLTMSTAVFADGIDGPMQPAKIKVGINAEFKPFEYYDENGSLTGFDIDLMNYIGERIGFEIEFINMPFDKLIPAVVKGEVDCAISCIAVVDERDFIIDYTTPYLVSQSEPDGVTQYEKYAVVFPNKSKEKAILKAAAGEPYTSIYTLVDGAVKELINDSTVDKLIEKYGLNKATEETGYSNFVANEDDGNYAGTGPVIVGDGVVPTDEEHKTSGTSVPYSDWAKSDIEKAIALNIINVGGNYNFSAPITREAFCELVYDLIYNYSKIDLPLVPDGSRPIGDTLNEKIRSLYFWGIINGKGTFTQEPVYAPDGVVKRYFPTVIIAPNDFLTREEAATIIIRMVNKFFPMAATEMWFEYDDIIEISEWASDSVQTISNLGFMKGVGNNNFAPQDNYTTEQAIVTLVRVYASSGVSKFDDMTFADKLYVNMPVDKNYMFSPLSIKMALMMAANGASGETLEEILKVTDVDDLEGYNESVRLMLDKYSESDILTLNVSNSIWINSDKTPQRFGEAYQDKLSKTFDATSGIVTDKNAVSEINGWVNDKTEGKIPTIITEDNKDFWAMLINAVYFKGRWQNEFNKGATEKDVFTSRDSSQTEIDFMNRRAWMSYANTDGVSIVSLPYLTRQDVFNENGEYVETKKLEGVNISMYLMMSDGSFNPEEILNKSEMDTTYIALSVPKFNIEYSTGLNDILKTIGINKAFEESAEFEEMIDRGNMWIDKSLHKTYIKVDEEGTEAAAVTGMGMGGSALPPEPLEIKYNKPFTFVIKDNINGEILFLGEYAFAEK